MLQGRYHRVTEISGRGKELAGEFSTTWDNLAWKVDTCGKDRWMQEEDELWDGLRMQGPRA